MSSSELRDEIAKIDHQIRSLEDKREQILKEKTPITRKEFEEFKKTIVKMIDELTYSNGVLSYAKFEPVT